MFRQRTYDLSTSSIDWYATDSGSAYAPLHRRTREPAVASSRQSLSVRRRYACSTAPVVGKSTLEVLGRLRVESVVEWSSMSSVTVVPASLAAAQIACA